MRALITFLICLLCSSVHGAIDAIQKTVLTTNVYVLGTNLFLTNGVLESVDSDSAAGITFPLSVPNGGTGNDLSSSLHGGLPYYDFFTGKLVAPTIIYTNALLWNPSLGTLSIIHTNSTTNPLLILQDNGASAPSIQLYSSRLVIANTNLSLEAVGPFSVDLRVDGSNRVQAAQSGAVITGNADISGMLTVNNLPIGVQLFLSKVPTGASAYITNVYTKNLAIGDNSILTVPGGYRFLPLSIRVTPTNTTSGSCWMSVITNSVTTQIIASSSVTTNGSALFPQGFIFEQGETMVIHTATNFFRTAVFGLIYTNSIPLFNARSLAVSNGDNTLYTTPPNKYAVSPVFAGTSLQHNFQYFNGTSATTIQRDFYIIPSGEVKDLNSRFINTSVAAQTLSSSSLPPVFFPGDSLLVNINAATTNQVAWIAIWEQ